jgi:uncharacterized protein YndB with AHSA1/START domain
MTVVASVNVTMPSDREIAITRLFDAPRSLVYDCYTKPELLKRWMGPDSWDFTTCDNDLRVGGAFHWVWRNASGQTLGMRGVYREIARPERIARTEMHDSDPAATETLGTLVLSEQDGKTDVTMTVRFPSTKARDGALQCGMTKGIAASQNKLDTLLAELGRAQSAA